MLQIGEFSKICQVSVKTLRHYDKIGLLTPVKVDDFTGYRYYDVAQIDRMNYIRRLKRYGFSLEEIREILNLSDRNKLCEALREREKKLEDIRRETAVILNEIKEHISEFERTGDIMTYQKGYVIELKAYPAMNVLAKRAKMSVNEYGKYYGSIFERVSKEKVTPSGIVGARYFDEEFNPECSDIELFISIREKEKADEVMDSRLSAMTVHKGPYSALPEAYGAIMEWISENGYETEDAPFEIYRKTQFDGAPPEEWETEVYFPVRKK